MTGVDSSSFQIAVRLWLGIFPVLMVRDAHPIGDGPGTWSWSRWRFPGAQDLIVVNAALMKFWRQP